MSVQAKDTFYIYGNFLHEPYYHCKSVLYVISRGCGVFFVKFVTISEYSYQYVTRYPVTVNPNHLGMIQGGVRWTGRG